MTLHKLVVRDKHGTVELNMTQYIQAQLGDVFNNHTVGPFFQNSKFTGFLKLVELNSEFATFDVGLTDDVFNDCKKITVPRLFVRNISLLPIGDVWHPIYRFKSTGPYIIIDPDINKRLESQQHYSWYNSHL